MEKNVCRNPFLLERLSVGTPVCGNAWLQALDLGDKQSLGTGTPGEPVL
jgi:hypothetical protein